MKLFSPLTFLLAASLFLSACSFSLAGDVTPPPGARQESMPVTPAGTPAATQPASGAGLMYPLVAPNPQAGAAIYQEKCAPCHGQTGMGDGAQSAQLPNPPSALGDPQVARKATPAGWYDMVTNGNIERYMPPFDSLTDSQRWDVVAFAFSLSAPAEQAALGGDIYAASCASCHGESGRGDGPQAAGAMADFTDQSYMAAQSAAALYEKITSGMPPAMPAFADQLDEDERWALTAYLRSLSFTPAHGVAGAGEPETPGAATPEAGAPVTPTLSTGSVTGSVINGSGGDPLADLTVTLHGFDGMQIVYTQTTTTDSNGVYSFKDVEMPAERVFLTYTEFGEATYSSNIATVNDAVAGEAAAEAQISLDITAFETSTDASVLNVDRLHVFFDFTKPEVIQVIELFIISNPSQKTVLAEKDGDPIVQFSLPPGAVNLQFQDGALGDRYIPTDAGFADTIPVRPSAGEYQVLFAFELPYTNKLELTQPMHLPVNAIVMMLPEGGVKLKGEGLEDGGAQQVEGFTYHMYNAEGLAAGQDFQVTLSGNPSGSNLLTGAGNNSSLIIGLGSFGLVLIVAGLWLYRRSGNASEEGEAHADRLAEAAGEEESMHGEPGDESALIDAIIALDDLYRAGELPEGAYHERRAQLKARLADLHGNQADKP